MLRSKTIQRVDDFDDTLNEHKNDQNVCKNKTNRLRNELHDYICFS